MLKSAKFSWWDWTLGPVLKLLWNPISIKQSHFWNWEVYNDWIGQTLVVQKCDKAKNRNSFWGNLWQTNFGWKSIEFIRPVSFGFNLNADEYILSFETEDYHLGFYNKDKSQNEICWLKLNGLTAVLAGDKDTEFFALNAKTMKPMDLKSYGRTTKKEFRKYKIKNNFEKTPLI